jgi:hypothetical protein
VKTDLPQTLAFARGFALLRHTLFAPRKVERAELIAGATEYPRLVALVGGTTATRRTDEVNHPAPASFLDRLQEPVQQTLFT